MWNDLVYAVYRCGQPGDCTAQRQSWKQAMGSVEFDQLDFFHRLVKHLRSKHVFATNVVQKNVAQPRILYGIKINATQGSTTSNDERWLLNNKEDKDVDKDVDSFKKYFTTLESKVRLDVERVKAVDLQGKDLVLHTAELSLDCFKYEGQWHKDGRTDVTWVNVMYALGPSVPGAACTMLRPDEGPNVMLPCLPQGGWHTFDGSTSHKVGPSATYCAGGRPMLLLTYGIETNNITSGNDSTYKAHLTRKANQAGSGKKRKFLP